MAEIRSLSATESALAEAAIADAERVKAELGAVLRQAEAKMQMRLGVIRTAHSVPDGIKTTFRPDGDSYVMVIE